MTRPARQFVAKVFGHLHHRLHQIEHLTPILDHLGFLANPSEDGGLLEL